MNYKQSSPAELEKTLREASKAYWETGTSFLSDPEYDELTEKLRALEPDNQLLTEIGAVPVAAKVVHKVPMLSLDKAYTFDQVRHWFARVRVESGCEHMTLDVTPKYDGIAGKWAGGVLSTRGNGLIGENITNKLDIIRVPVAGAVAEWVEVPSMSPFIGEIVMPVASFQKFKEKAAALGITYKTPRNTVAGLINAKEIPQELLDVIHSENLYLHMVPYTNTSWEVPDTDLYNDALMEKLTGMIQQYSRTEYPCDGVVFKVFDKGLYERLGVTTHHPRGAIAYKFKNSSTTTVIKDIEWSAGKEALTPVAILEPVDLGGVTVSRASLHNAQNLEDKDICIGDTVTVERAGDVIPYISAVVSRPETRRRADLSVCPVCGAPVSYEKPEVYCTNDLCPGKTVKNLLATSRIFDVDLLAEATIQKLVDTFHVRTWLDILHLTKEQWLQVPGFGELSVRNIMSSIEKSKTAEPWKVLAGLNIRLVGKTVSRSILTWIPLEELPDAGVDKLASIGGIGLGTARSIVRFFENPDMVELFRNLCKELTISSTDDVPKQTVCFTGAMEHPRRYYEEQAIARGMEPVQSVTKALSLLVTTNMESESSKMKKARSLGIRICTVEEWENND